MLIVGDKVLKKAKSIEERRNSNRQKAQENMEKLKDQLLLHEFLQVGCRRFIYLF